MYSPNRHAKGGGYLDGDENLRFKEQETTTAPDLYVNPDPAGIDLVRAPYIHHAEDNDTVQATDLYENVYDDAAKERLADNITNAMAGVSPETEERVYAYWDAVSEKLGKRVRELFAEKK